MTAIPFDAAVGHCTQLAVFVRDDNLKYAVDTSKIGTPYKLVFSTTFPQASNEEIHWSLEDKLEEIKYQLSVIFFMATTEWESAQNEDTVNHFGSETPYRDEEATTKVRFICGLERLWESMAIQKICLDRDDLSNLMRACGFVELEQLPNDDGLVLVKSFYENESSDKALETRQPWLKFTNPKSPTFVDRYFRVDFIFTEKKHGMSDNEYSEDDDEESWNSS